MIIFRPHRGGLNRSMREKKEFESVGVLKEYIAKYYGDKMLDVEDIVIDTEEVNDTRTGWEDTKSVCIKRMGSVNFIEQYGTAQCIGYCATKYPQM